MWQGYQQQTTQAEQPQWQSYHRPTVDMSERHEPEPQQQHAVEEPFPNAVPRRRRRRRDNDEERS